MKSESRHILRSIRSTIDIRARSEIIWENITNVKLDQYSDPILFKLLGIPKPLSADIISTGVGGQRIAYFDSGKKFMQRITTWTPLQEYSFDFNPEKGFIVGHFFDLSDGIFRVPNGTYILTERAGTTTLNFPPPTALTIELTYCLTCPFDLYLKAFSGIYYIQ